jgi:ribosomal protein L11 methyltransferase
MPLRWLELSVDTPPEFVEPVSHIFYRYGHGGVVVEEKGGFNPDEGEPPPVQDTVTVKTYLPLDATMESRRSGIDVGVKLVSHLCPLSPLRERVIEEEDWQHAWKTHFHVLHVGKHLVVVPTWRRYRPKPLDVVIRLDPGMAFGTGHHPTTRMCLELLEEHSRPGVRVLDVGCGSGILSIAAVKLGAGAVLGLDADSVAARTATENIRLNRVSKAVAVYEGTLPHPEVAPGSYDIAVANISAVVVSKLSAELVAAVRTGGMVLASGFLLEKQAEVEERLRDAGADVERVITGGDWVALAARKTA